MEGSTASDSANNIPTFDLDLNVIKREMKLKSWECQQRGLIQTFKWISELCHALKDIRVQASATLDDDEDSFVMAKSYFDLKEYDRASFFTKDCSSSKAKFLHFYAR